MKFKESPIKGIWIIECEPLLDERGFFMRSFCKKELHDHGLNMEIVQSNISYNKYRGIIRGMHFQSSPVEEIKIVSCIHGSVYDVAVDLRRDSPTFLQWHAEILSEDSHLMLYIPKGCAHGFQTLEDNCMINYAMSEYYMPKFQQGVRWNDPSINIKWPLPITMISDKDKNHPDFIP